ARPDELHQVLVGGDDEHVGAGLRRLARIGGDEVVRLVAVLLDGLEAEGAHGLAHQGGLRNEIFRGLLPVRLVGRIDLLAEGLLRLVEDDGEMGRGDADRALADELEQLGAEQAHGAGGQAVRAVVVFPVLVHGLEIGAEDEGRAVDEEDVVPRLQGTGDVDGNGGGGLLGHGSRTGASRESPVRSGRDYATPRPRSRSVSLAVRENGLQPAAARRAGAAMWQARGRTKSASSIVPRISRSKMRGATTPAAVTRAAPQPTP